MQLFDRAQKLVVQIESMSEQRLGGCHLQEDLLVMASRNKLQFWKIRISSNKCQLEQYYKNWTVSLKGDSSAVCVRLSTANEFCAVGFKNGLIQLFRQHPERPKLVYELRSHTTQVHSLLFSPWTSDHRQPVILASVSEELCFWNVTFAVNNPSVDDEPARLSERFADRPSPGSPGEHRSFDETDSSTSPWIGKLGPTRKQVLLSCFKFIGNAAQQLFANAEFTRFLTIDDVGEIYFLKVRYTDTNEVDELFDFLRLEENESLPTEVDDSESGSDEIYEGSASLIRGGTVLKLRPINGHDS